MDQYFNRVTGINNPVTVNSPDSNILVPDGAALVNGEAYILVTVFLANNQTLNVSDNVSDGIEAPASSAFAVAAGPYARLLLIAPGEGIQAGTDEGRIGEPTDQSITYLFTVTALQSSGGRLSEGGRVRPLSEGGRGWSIAQGRGSDGCGWGRR